MKFAPRILVPTYDAIDTSAIRIHQDQNIIFEGATQLALLLSSSPNLIWTCLARVVQLNGHRWCTCTKTKLKQASLPQSDPSRLSSSPLSFILPLSEIWRIKTTKSYSDAEGIGPSVNFLLVICLYIFSNR